VVPLLSSDTEEELELLFLSPPRGPASHVSEPFSSSGSDQFDDWPEANDTTASVYVALTTYVLSSHISIVNSPHDDRESRADISSSRQSRSWVTLSQKPHQQKYAVASAP
jgi:hypothetical protein